MGPAPREPLTGIWLTRRGVTALHHPIKAPCDYFKGLTEVVPIQAHVCVIASAAIMHIFGVGRGDAEPNRMRRTA